jgi:hypothetical protein
MRIKRKEVVLEKGKVNWIPYPLREWCSKCAWWHDHRQGYRNGQKYLICMECGLVTLDD